MKTPPRTLLARLQMSRRGSLLVFGVTLGALVFAAIWFSTARSNLAQAYALVGDRQQTLAQTQQLRQEAQLQVRFATEARKLLAEAESAGFNPADWGERRIGVSQTQMSRGEINDLLSGTSRSGSRIFGADAFELSVTRPDEGLFDVPLDRQPLSLSVRGTLLFRTRNQAQP